MDTIIAAAVQAMALTLPPASAASLLASLRLQVAQLPRVSADVDAARAGELAPLVDALAR